MLKFLSARKAPTDPMQARLARAKPGDSLRDIFAGCTDEQWVWALTEGRQKHDRIRALLPSLPPDELQAQFTGRSHRLAFEQAAAAVSLFLSEARSLGLDTARPGFRLMDMGCGWGRITQTFLRDFEPDQIIGVDVMDKAIEACRSTGLPCEVRKIPHFPPLEFETGSFDLIVAFSVFSHLSEPAHLAWVRELSRLLRPGGVAAVTTRPRSFIKMAEHMRAHGAAVPAHARGAATSFVDTPAWLDRYDRGEFCFDAPHISPDWPGVYYGEAAAPEGFVLRTWAPFFEEVRFTSAAEHGRFDQSLITARKP